jgi:hypothetical protein
MSFDLSAGTQSLFDKVQLTGLGLPTALRLQGLHQLVGTVLRRGRCRCSPVWNPIVCAHGLSADLGHGYFGTATTESGRTCRTCFYTPLGVGVPVGTMFLYALGRWVLRNCLMLFIIGLLTAILVSIRPLGVGYFGTPWWRAANGRTSFYTPLGVGYFGTVRSQSSVTFHVSIRPWALGLRNRSNPGVLDGRDGRVSIRPWALGTSER